MRDGPVLLCGSCGYGPLDPVLDMGIQPLPQACRGGEPALRYPLRLVQCRGCTLVQLDYIAPQHEVFPAGYPYATGNTAALREHFRKLAGRIAGTLPLGGLVIDIGGNDGTMLKALQSLTTAPEPARLMLIEPTDQAKKCDAPGIEVVQEYFTADLARAIRDSHGPAAVITASNVFAHVPDPHDFLDGVSALLADDGRFVTENHDWASIVNGLQIDAVYSEHLRYYSVSSLSYLLAMHGFLVSSAEPVASHGGSFRTIARRQQPGLADRAAGLASRLAGLLAQAARAGPVYGIGAPTRATPLVNYAGIGEFLACTCELPASEKAGARIPGTQVPIVDEARLFTDQPPHALLLAWNLAGTIVPSVRRRGYTGKIIIPLPEPRVIDA
jgi:hypothetical protein